MDDSNAPWHAHIYYAPGDRSRAAAFRGRLIRLKESVNRRNCCSSENCAIIRWARTRYRSSRFTSPQDSYR